MADPLDWDDVQLFLEVARAGSFSRAAQGLGFEQSTVSRRVAALEGRWGAQVFERRAAGATLTPLGERLLTHAQAVESDVQRLRDEVAGHEREVRGNVRLALTESIAVHAVIPLVLPALRRRHPALQVQLITSYAAAELGHREAELALRFFRPASGDLCAKRVARLPTAVLAHERLRCVPAAALDWIGLELGGVPLPEELWRSAHVGGVPALIMNSYTAQIEAVRRGLGAALLARALLEVDDALIELPGYPAGPVLELWLVTPMSLRNVPRVAALWDALEEGLAGLTKRGGPAR